MNEWISSFVFSYGESQLITETETKTVSNDDLNAIGPLVAYLASIQQGVEPITVQSMFSMNIFNNTFLDFLYNIENVQPERFNWEDLDQQLIDTLINEMIAAQPVAVDQQAVIANNELDEDTAPTPTAFTVSEAETPTPIKAARSKKK